MAGIRLEWAQFGDFDSFDVIRSDAPMDINALPSPIATNLPTMYYVDTTVVEGAIYYYRVVAWRDAVSKVSGEIKLKASVGDGHWDKVVALLHFDGDLVNEATGLSATGYSPVFREDNPILNGKYFFRGWAELPMTNLGTEDFTAEVFFRLIGNPNPFCFLWDGRTSGDGPYNVVYLSSDRKIHNHAQNGTVGPHPSNVMNIGEVYHFAHVRLSGVSIFYLNGENIGSAVDTTNYVNASGILKIKSYVSVDNLEIDELRITKGVARYTANFTPPTEPFPSS